MTSIDDARREAIVLAKEARALRRSLDDIGVGMTMRRRRLALVLGVLTVLAMFLVDYHVQHCLVVGPGIYIEALVCDATFPLHSHGPSTGGRLIGFLIYIGALARASWWATHRPPIDNDRRSRAR